MLLTGFLFFFFHLIIFFHLFWNYHELDHGLLHCPSNLLFISFIYQVSDVLLFIFQFFINFVLFSLSYFKFLKSFHEFPRCYLCSDSSFVEQPLIHLISPSITIIAFSSPFIMSVSHGFLSLFNLGFLFHVWKLFLCLVILSCLLAIVGEGLHVDWNFCAQGPHSLVDECEQVWGFLKRKCLVFSVAEFSFSRLFSRDRSLPPLAWGCLADRTVELG